MKNYKNFNKIFENILTESKISYDDAEKLLDKMKNDQIEIDWKSPEDAPKKNQEWIKMMKDRFIHNFENRLKRYKEKGYDIYLPESLYDYEHPITGEICSFVLTSDKITLASLSNKLEWEEIDTPESLIKGNYIDFELDFPSGKVCLLGDNIRDLIEEEWGDFKYSNNYYGIEADALKHINYFLEKGYFFVADDFTPSLSKNGDEYTLYKYGYDDEKDEEIFLPNTIEQSIHIDSDHTLVIIDSDLLDKKLKETNEDFDQENYFKYCFDVKPGKYNVKFNWRYKKEDGILKYIIMKKI
jgi:hypothetical protein